MKLFKYLQDSFERLQAFALKRMLPSDVREKDPLLYWRGRILLAILFTGLALSLFILIPTIPLLIREKVWSLAVVDSVAVVLAFGLAFGSIKYKIRAVIALLLAYGIGLTVLISVGPLSGSTAWLFTFAVFAGVLLGSRAAIFAIALNTLTVTTVFWLLSTGQFGRTFPFFNTWEVMVAAGINFTLLNVIAAVSVSVLLKGLVSTHQKEKILFRTLEQKKAWEELEKRVGARTRELKIERDRSQQYLDVAGVMILALNDRGEITQVNKKGCEILESGEDSIVGKNWFQNFLPESDAQEVQKVFHQLMKNQASGAEYVENRIITAMGVEKIMAWHNALLWNQQGKIVGTLSSGEDITERKHTERRLLQSEKGFRELFDSMTDLIFSHDLDGRFISANNAMINLFGYGRDELIGAPASDFMKPEMKAFFKNHYLEKIKTDGFVDGVTCYLTKDGKKVYIEYRNALVVPVDGGAPYISGSGRDVTERILSQREIKRLQNQIVQSQKMEAIGLMAGGVAHDLNNILSGIVSYPELLLLDLPEDSSLKKPIKTIQAAGKRAADVVADLLTMARGVATEKKGLNLNSIVSEYLESLEFRKLEKNHAFVQFSTDLAPDLLNMSGSPIHMKKVLMNLVINASEAIEGGGTVGISTLNRYLEEPFKGYEDVCKGEYVVLTVSDDGSGISPEDLGRIFEPFYTKKVMDRSGTGLGLAVVWNTVQDHDGYINIHTKAKGTVFELYFPVNRDATPDEKETSDLKNCRGRGETILVVDDEEQQREIACGMLANLGYRTRSVPSGEAAIEYVKQHTVDLVVLDMVMPKGFNGRETYEAILKVRPAQKAVIATGYAKTEEVALSQALGAGHYIKKPYSLKEIGIAVKNELEKPAAGGTK
jgi:PAS domain S-box-containing protein